MLHTQAKTEVISARTWELVPLRQPLDVKNVTR